MQPLSLTEEEQDAYHEHLATSHEFEVDVDVLNMEEEQVGDLSNRLIDGQVNVQRDGTIRRTATFQIFDPNRSLRLDSEDPQNGAVFADRMIRAKHIVSVPDVGDVVATPFVGPISKVSREEDILTIECQDKTALAINGVRWRKIPKGTLLTTAIRIIMTDCCGERKFRIPTWPKRRLKEAITVGWGEDVTPWVWCQWIARELGMVLFYSCDGWLTLCPLPDAPVLWFRQAGATDRFRGRLTSAVKSDFDISQVRNFVRAPGKTITKKADGADKDKEPDVSVNRWVVEAAPPEGHPMHPDKLGRNGVPRYLPLTIEEDFKTRQVAQRRVNQELWRLLPQLVTGSFDGIPVYHLDVFDMIAVETDAGSMWVRFNEASLPLGVTGDMSMGAIRSVSRPRRRQRRG